MKLADRVAGHESASGTLTSALATAAAGAFAMYQLAYAESVGGSGQCRL